MEHHIIIECRSNGIVQDVWTSISAKLLTFVHNCKPFWFISSLNSGQCNPRNVACSGITNRQGANSVCGLPQIGRAHNELLWGVCPHNDLLWQPTVLSPPYFDWYPVNTQAWIYLCQVRAPVSIQHWQCDGLVTSRKVECFYYMSIKSVFNDSNKYTNKEL